MNSKDLCALEYVDRLINCGVDSFKIEGRMKTQYYVANTVNAYRRVIDRYAKTGNIETCNEFFVEPQKCANRGYTTGFYLGRRDDTINLLDSTAASDVRFLAEVLSYDANKQTALIEQRNRFHVGDTVEILSNNNSFNRRITVEGLTDESGDAVDDAKLVQQRLILPCAYPLSAGDMLRSVPNATAN